MKKIICLLLIVASMFTIVGCTQNFSSSLMLVETGAINKWNISWQKMTGTVTKDLILPSESEACTLEYTMEGDLEDVTVTVKYNGEEITLEEVASGSVEFTPVEPDRTITIVVKATGANKTKLTFKLT